MTNANTTYPELDRITRGVGVEVLEDAENQARQALDEIDELRRWKAEALIVLSDWDDTFDALPPYALRGSAGHAKPLIVRRFINDLMDIVR